jgi:hypothetical protein
MAFETQEEEATDVEPPGEFLQRSKWKPFKEGAIDYFSSIRGHGQISLAYVMRENKIPDPNQVYGSERQWLIAITPLLGI